MKYIVALIGLIFNSLLFSQVEPFNVEVEEEGRLPQVFALAENHFTFNSVSTVSDAKITSGGSQWSIEKFSDGLFKVKSTVYGRSQSVDLDSVIRVSLMLENGDTIHMIAPIRVYADVKILPFGEGVIDSSTALHCAESVGFMARWDYPSYVKRRWRICAIFDMVVFKGDEQISGFTGWYDSGDRTKLQKLRPFASLGDLTIKVRNIKTLHRYSQNGKQLTVHLSKDSPREWTMSCEEHNYE